MNLEDDTLNQETNNFITETNLISISNYNTLNQNEYKIEDREMINNLFFIKKFSLLNQKNIPDDIFIKNNTNINEILLNQKNFSINKNDNRTQSTDWLENGKSKSNL